MSDGEPQDPAPAGGRVFKPLKAASTRTESTDPIEVGSSDEVFDQPDEPETVFKPLKKSSTRTEELDPIEVGSSDEVFDQPDEPDTVFTPLKAASTRTESADDAVDATPLVVMDDDEVGEGTGDVPSGLVVDEGVERTASELLGELRGLRSRNQILRTERTSIAGRKYALEMVVESLREKLEEVAAMCEALDAPGELGEKLREIREVLGDARRIASTKAVLEADLEAERAKQLEQRQQFEQETFELGQQVTGLRSERDTLRERVGRLERERIDQLERLTELQDHVNDQDRAVTQVESRAAEQLESYAERIQGLEADLERAQASAAVAEGKHEAAEASRRDLEQALEEAVQHAEQANARAAELEGQVNEARDVAIKQRKEATRATKRLSSLELELNDQRDKAQAELDAAQAAAAAKVAMAEAAAQRAATNDEAIEDLRRRAAELEGKVGSQKATLEEQRKALLELKPILEDWTRLENENQRLSRLVGEARARGRVNVQELMARAALLKRLEKLTAEPTD